MGDTRLRAQAPKCIGHKCSNEATGINHYGSVRSNGCPSWNTRAVPYCSSHEAQLRNEFTPQMIHDRYQPILLATLGDELWLSLEHMFWTIHGLLDDKFDNEADNAAARARRLGRSAA